MVSPLASGVRTEWMPLTPPVLTMEELVCRSLGSPKSSTRMATRLANPAPERRILTAWTAPWTSTASKLVQSGWTQV